MAAPRDAEIHKDVQVRVLGSGWRDPRGVCGSLARKQLLAVHAGGGQAGLEFVQGKGQLAVIKDVAKASSSAGNNSRPFSLCFLLALGC